MIEWKTRLFIIESSLGAGYDDKELYRAYSSLIESDEDEALLMEACSLFEFDRLYNPGQESFSYQDREIKEAVTYKNYPALKKGVNILARKFAEALGNSEVTLTGWTKPAELKPRKNKLFAYVAVEFTFSDGQTVKIMFHSPGGEARQFDMDDALVSYAFTLNKRDVTHLFAEKKGLSIARFVRRMTQILLKNSEKFQQRQTNLAETKQQLAEADTAATELEGQIVQTNADAENTLDGNEDLKLEIKDLELSIADAKKEKARLEGLRTQAAPKGEETPEAAPPAVEPEAAPPAPEAAAPGEPVWEKPDAELRAMSGAALQAVYQGVKDRGLQAESQMLLAKAVGNKTNFKEARALFNLLSEIKPGDPKDPKENSYWYRLMRLKKILEKKMNDKIAASPEAAAEPEAGPAIPEAATPEPAVAEPEAASASEDGSLIAQAREHIAKGEEILAGKYNDDRETLTNILREMLTFHKKHDKGIVSYVVEMEDLYATAEKVSEYYTQLLSRKTKELADRASAA